MDLKQIEEYIEGTEESKEDWEKKAKECNGKAADFASNATLELKIIIGVLKELKEDQEEMQAKLQKIRLQVIS